MTFFSKFALLLALTIPATCCGKPAVSRIVQQQNTKTYNVCVATNRGGILPLNDINARPIVVAIAGMGGSQGVFAKRCADYADVTVCDLAAQSIGDVAAKAAKAQLIIGISDQRQLKAACTLAKKCEHTIVAITAPISQVNAFSRLITMKTVDAVVIGFYDTAEQHDLVAQTVFGGRRASGSVPLNIIAPDGTVAVKKGSRITFAATRLGYGKSGDVGLGNDLERRVDSVCNLCISEKAFPGCQVLIAKDGKVVYSKSFGEINYDSGTPVTKETLYGLASVSKATGTLSAVMKLYDEGKLKLDSPASTVIPGLRRDDKQDITFRQLLYHETGMPPSLNMWQLMMDSTTYSGKLITSKPTETNTIWVMKDAYGNKDARLRTDILSTMPTTQFPTTIANGIYGGKATLDTIMNHIYSVPLRQSKKYLYSCLNFCLLADAAQRLDGRGLDKIVSESFAKPLGATRMCYRPLEQFAPSEIAFTEQDTYLRRQHIHGYVHDELAAFSLGVQGNAGLFANTASLAKLFQMWLNGGTYGGQRFLSEATVTTFLRDKSPNSHRGLGFDKPWLDDLESSSCCNEAPPQVVGHTGFTGTCFWLDPDNKIIYIFLSNRVCPTRTNPTFTKLSPRSHIQQIIYQELDKAK